MPLTAESLAQAMGSVLSNARYAELLPTYNQAMIAAECTTVRRAAAWHSQLGHESLGLKYMAEIETNGAGWSEDRRIYRGRGPIQLTWSGNYRKFGIWCKANGLVTDSEIFVNDPTLVEDPKWGFLAASWYWLEGGPRKGRINEYADAGDILAVSRCVNGWVEGQDPNGLADRKIYWNRALSMGERILPNPEGIPIVPTNRPDFNELNKIGIENGSHSSIRSQLPRNWFAHTQQGNGNAEDLFNFLMSTSGESAVSYHYAIAEDRNDHGVTVVDVCDTDRYSWSVLNANVFSINACFAGSFAEQTRDEWLANYRNAIRVAAYLAVEDCKKYPTIPAIVIPPPYANHGGGISDHRFVTKALGIGSHTDVGGPMGPPWNGFPWDVLDADVKSFLAPVTTGPDTPPPVVDTAPVKRFPEDWTDREIGIESLRQLRGPSLSGWHQLENKSVVDYLPTLKGDA